MTVINRSDNHDPEVATHEYEELRANVLGKINRAARLTLFLRDGMSAWLRGPGDPARSGCARPATPSAASCDLGTDVPGSELVAILADAILVAGTASYFGGNK